MGAGGDSFPAPGPMRTRRSQLTTERPRRDAAAIRYPKIMLLIRTIYIIGGYSRAKNVGAPSKRAVRTGRGREARSSAAESAASAHEPG
jgi:hypothetical protein